MAKLKLYPYSKKFTEIFDKQKRVYSKFCGKCEIHHVGSTAVPRLGGKGIIDIMIAIKDWKDGERIVRKLKTIGFTHVHPKNKGRIFISQPGETKFGGTHIHLVKKGSKEYKNLLFFRDYLGKHKKDVKEYAIQKIMALNQAKRNRTIYTKLKEKYIKNLLKNAA